MSNQKPRHRDRIYAFFGSKKEAPPPTSSLLDKTSSGPSGVIESPDRRRTKARYVEAANLLEEAVQGQEERWGKFEFPELNGELEQFDVSQFTTRINTLLGACESKVQDETAWGKCEHIMKCIFTACSPFAENFLTIAKQGQSIPVLNPYGLLVGGLLLFIKIANKEIARREEFEKILIYMSRQLEQLAVLDDLPKDLKQIEYVIYRAFDVRSASMIYLSTYIRHSSTPFGAAGRMVKVFFTGEEKFIDAKADLEECVTFYRDAINIVQTRMLARILENLKANDPNTLVTMGNMALTYINEGKLDKAAQVGEKLLERSTQLQGAENPNTALVMGNLAWVYIELQKWDEAAKLGEKLLKRNTKWLGPEHPDTALVMGRLALVYMELEKWDTAVKLGERLLKRNANWLGQEHADTAFVMEKLIIAYMNIGKWDDAVKIGEKLLKRNIKWLGEENPDTVGVKEKLITAYRSQGNLKAAVELESKMR